MSTVRLYHGTCDSFVQSIKAVGLEPGRGNGADDWAKAIGWTKMTENIKLRPPSVYVTNDRFWAEQFANVAAAHNNCKPRVLEFEVPIEDFESHFVPDEQTPDASSGERAYRSEKTVNRAWIKRTFSEIRAPMFPI